MWDLPGPGLKPMSPALAGRFLTTAPQGKPLDLVLIIWNINMIFSVIHLKPFNVSSPRTIWLVVDLAPQRLRVCSVRFGTLLFPFQLAIHGILLFTLKFFSNYKK